MARQTRRSARLGATAALSPSPSTPTTSNNSPIFSTKTSEISETPHLTDEEALEKQETDEPKTQLRRSARTSIRTTKSSSKANANTKKTTGKRGRKSAAAEDLVTDDETQAASKPVNPAAKKRKVSQRQVMDCVEISTPTNKLLLIKGARGMQGKSSADNSPAASVVPSVPPTPCESSDGGVTSEDGLDFDEAADLESNSEADEENDSDFEESEDDDEDYEEALKSRRKPTRARKNMDLSDDDFVENAEDIDAIMLDAAVKLSKNEITKRGLRFGGAGPSNETDDTATETAAALCAAAAERRLAKGRDVIDANGFPNDGAPSDDDSVPSTGDESTTGWEKVKSKGKGKGVVRSSLFEEGISQHEKRRLQRIARRERKEEIRREEYRLGRKLTHAEKSTLALHRFHPSLKDVWGNLADRVPVIKPEEAEQPAGLKVSLLPFQRESLFWMRKQENSEWAGGMLADEMGMGKTIQTLALLVTDGTGPNLVVAPTVAIMQWRNEIEKYTDGLKVTIWHGSSREAKASELKKYDVVLTTYAVLESAFRRQERGFKRKGGNALVTQPSIVHQIVWHRIILDEAHNIKERATNTAKAAFGLQSKYKWCLSGTPLQNRVGELYSLVRFLGGDPFSYYFCKFCDCKSLHWEFTNKKNCDTCGHSPMQHTCFWNNEILTPIQKHGLVGVGETAFKKLRILLERMMLRRTKVERADDLGLPPRTIIVRRDYFSPEEKDLYLSLFSDAKRQFSYYVDQGTVLNNYSNIFSLITRMRQMACHPDLVLRSKNNADKFAEANVDEAPICRLCNDIAEDAIRSKCRHIFDRECIKQYINSAVEQVPACPVCHLPLTIDLEAPALDIDNEVATTVRQGILGRLDVDKWRSSSKIEALIEELVNLRNQDATVKSIVFSQFVNFLDLISFRLQRAGFNICRLEGTMTPQARDATIKHFMNNVHVTVFLVSLKAGGVALNLTEASRVYLMDSWWNPAVEFQAMDRIHRLGQHRPVQAIKLVIEDSIESRIVQLQEKKSAMINATLSTDEQAMGRLTPEDLSFLFRL